MSTSDANSFSGSPALRSVEQGEIAQECCAEFVRDTPRQFAEAMMMTLARPLGDNHKAASIYDDYFRSKHYMTGMNDLFTEILQSREK